jgi:hypothetical protein
LRARDVVGRQQFCNVHLRRVDRDGDLVGLWRELGQQVPGVVAQPFGGVALVLGRERNRAADLEHHLRQAVAQPGDLTNHRKAFSCSAQFNSVLNGITCRKRALDRAMPRADPQSLRTIGNYRRPRPSISPRRASARRTSSSACCSAAGAPPNWWHATSASTAAHYIGGWTGWRPALPR